MKPILVTGAARGLGASVCRQLAAEGHDLVIHYRSSHREALKLLEECRSFGVNAETLQGDFATLSSLNLFISTYQSLFPHTKGLVNNVGNYFQLSSQETSESQWYDLFQTNFFAPVFLTRALIPSIRKEQGSIVNIGVTGLGAHRGFTQTTAYATTKEALRSFTVSLAKEEAPHLVRVNMISPSYMENAVDLKDPQQLPMKRAAGLSEVAALVATFFDPLTAYVTGQNLEVAGGSGL